jgi:hypothetical protein
MQRHKASSAFRLLGVVWFCLALPVPQGVSAQQPAKKPAPYLGEVGNTAPPCLAFITWADAPITWEALRDKTVILLVYTPQPDDEKWVGPFFKKLKETIRDKPIVVLAIDASKNGDAGFTYVKAKGFSAPNIILGRDPAMFARVAPDIETFKYAFIVPEGKVLFCERAVPWEHPADVSPNHNSVVGWLERCAKNRQYQGSFHVLTEEMTPKMKRLLWPLELDRYVSESSLKAAKHKLTEAERQGIDKALDEFLAAELDAVKRFSRGDPAQQLSAYEKATAIATVYKGRDEAGKAQELGKELARDAKFKRELAAKAAFQKLMRKAGDDLTARSRAMATVAKTYPGAYYGQLAAGDSVAPPPVRRFVLSPLKLLPEAEQKEFVARQQASSEELYKRVPGIALRAYESKRFLLFSDLSDGLVRNTFLPQLERMYDELCKLYGLDPAQRIWNGKAVIYAFSQQEDFRKLESLLPAKEPEFTLFVCHVNRDDTVTINCSAQKDQKNLEWTAAGLIHVTAQGFNRLYRTDSRLPSWVDEGVAEWVAKQVAGGTYWGNGRAHVLTQLRFNGYCLGGPARDHKRWGDFFSRKQIEPCNYGAASEIAEFLMGYNPSAARVKAPDQSPGAKPAVETPYCTFINAIKDGVPSEEALKQVYKMTPEQLVRAYGESIGIHDLKP